MSKKDRDDILAARAADAMARVASAAKGKDMSEWEDESGSRISQTTNLDSLLCTEGRRRIWRALRLGREIHITPDQRAVDRETGEDYGNQIAIQEIVFAGFARFRPGCEWVVEWRL